MRARWWPLLGWWCGLGLLLSVPISLSSTGEWLRTSAPPALIWAAFGLFAVVWQVVPPRTRGKTTRSITIRAAAAPLLGLGTVIVSTLVAVLLQHMGWSRISIRDAALLLRYQRDEALFRQLELMAAEDDGSESLSDARRREYKALITRMGLVPLGQLSPASSLTPSWR